VHRLVWIAALCVACGSHPPEPLHNAANGSASAHSAPTAGSGSSAAVAIVPEVGCPNPTCVFHAGAAAYFTCLSGGAGICFHFGGPCAPADGCMFDPQQRTYRSCAKVVEGTCAQWNANTCAPASACMFDPDDGLHHHCDNIADGTCRKYGVLCAP
jgi:hypothetical protein